jgi:hypothetical protein
MNRLQMGLAKLATSCFLIFALAACAAFGVPAAPNFNAKVVAASKTVDAVASSAIQLRVAGKLNNAQRDKAVAACTTALSTIEIAKGLRPTDPLLAENRLSMALAIIVALQAFTADPVAGDAELTAALAAATPGARP